MTFGFNAVIQPDQFALMQQVFDDIANETWFDDAEENLEGLAAIVLHTFRAGKTEGFSLLEACQEIARQRFRR